MQIERLLEIKITGREYTNGFAGIFSFGQLRELEYYRCRYQSRPPYLVRLEPYSLMIDIITPEIEAPVSRNLDMSSHQIT